MKRTRIHPVLGVEVLTHAGYIAHMAERHGVSYEEEQQSHWDDMARAEQEEHDHLRDNALAILQEAVREQNKWGRCDTRLTWEKHNRCWAVVVDGERIASPPNRKSAERYLDEHLRSIGRLIAKPTALVEIRSVDPGSLYGGTQRIEAHAKRADGTEGVIVWTHWHHPGSYLEPPEDEVEVWWEEPEQTATPEASR